VKSYNSKRNYDFKNGGVLLFRFYCCKQRMVRHITEADRQYRFEYAVTTSRRGA